MWRFDCSSHTVTPFPLDSGASSCILISHLPCLSLLLPEGSESLDEASVLPLVSLDGITLMSMELPSLLLSSAPAWMSILMLILLMLHWKSEPNHLLLDVYISCSCRDLYVC